jgi:chemotaxis protein CheD
MARTRAERLPRSIGDRDLAIHVVAQGEHRIGREPCLFSVLLGSCVSVCVFDPVSRIGGLNHVRFPGDPAMAGLFADLARLGCEIDRVELKLFGGADVVSGLRPIGDMNVDYALGYVRGLGRLFKAIECGGETPRRVLFDPSSGQAWVKLTSARPPEPASGEAGR